MTFIFTDGNVTHKLIFRNYMNDSLRTDVFVRYQPETVACACIYLTSRKLNISLPKSPAWFTIFRVSEEDIQDVCFRILRLYKRPKVTMTPPSALTYLFTLLMRLTFLHIHSRYSKSAHWYWATKTQMPFLCISLVFVWCGKLQEISGMWWILVRVSNLIPVVIIIIIIFFFFL